MASTPPVHIEFPAGDVAEVVPFVGELSARGEGWINLEPGYDPDDAPPPRSLFGMAFSARGPDIPLCTWVPPQRHRRWTEPATVGVHHGAGRKAVDRLAAAGIEVPAEWLVTQDHPRRGLVLAVPDGFPADRMLAWLVQAGTALCPVPLSGWWRAAVHRPD